MRRDMNREFIDNIQMETLSSMKPTGKVEEGFSTVKH